MKAYELWGAVAPMLLGALVACGGTSSIGRGDPTDMQAGGESSSTGGTSTNSGSGSAVGSSGKTGAGATSNGGMSSGGMPTPGTGATSGEGMCMSDVDCPSAPCRLCGDGSRSCPKTYCADGRCINDDIAGYCPTQCSDDRDCLAVDAAGCIDCGDGTQTCPTGSCVMGYCQINFQGCKNKDPCVGLACGAACSPCPDPALCDVSGPSYCNRDGKCVFEEPSCAGGTACETKMDCGTPPPICVECGDGSCAGFECIENKCVFACSANPKPECKVSEDCPVMGDVCNQCSNGKCAVQACLQGSCELVCPFE